MTPVEIILIVISGVLLFIVYYILSKESELLRQIHAIANAVEEANRQIYVLEKNIYEIENNFKQEIKPRSMSDNEIYAEIERSAYDLINPVQQKLSIAEQNLSDLASVIDLRLSNLEGGIRQISVPSSIHGNDDTKITSLFQQGSTIDTIAKELHLSKAEVEFVLKINQLR